MSLYETSYGLRLAALKKLVRTIKTAYLAKAEKSALLDKARADAATLNIDLGRYNSPEFGAALA